MQRQIVAVKLFGLLGRLAGRREAHIEVGQDATLLEVLTKLAQLCGPEFYSAVFRTPDEVQTNIRLYFGQEEASVTDVVSPGAQTAATVEVLTLPAFEGGGS